VRLERVASNAGLGGRAQAPPFIGFLMDVESQLCDGRWTAKIPGVMSLRYGFAGHSFACRVSKMLVFLCLPKLRNRMYIYSHFRKLGAVKLFGVIFTNHSQIDEDPHQLQI
jgi:hypothetical protein